MIHFLIAILRRCFFSPFAEAIYLNQLGVFSLRRVRKYCNVWGKSIASHATLQHFKVVWWEVTNQVSGKGSEHFEVRKARSHVFKLWNVTIFWSLFSSMCHESRYFRMQLGFFFQIGLWIFDRSYIKNLKYCGVL